MHAKVGRGAVVLFDVPSNEVLHAHLNAWADIIPATFQVHALIEPAVARRFLEQQRGSTMTSLPAPSSPIGCSTWPTRLTCARPRRAGHAMSGTGSSRGRLTATLPKAVAFGVPPVAFGLGSIALPLADTEIQASVTARLFEFGVVSIALHVAVSDLPWGEFSHRVNAVNAAAGLARHPL